MALISPDVLQFYRDTPDYWVKQYLRTTPDPLQAAVMRDVFAAIQGKLLNTAGEQIRVVSVRTCHGVGKTATAGMVSNAFMALFPRSRCMVIAPTYNQVTNFTLNEIKKWMRTGDLAHEFEMYREKIVTKGRAESHFLLTRAGDDQNKIEGLHADYVLIIVDEAKGVPDGIFDALVGASTNTFVASLYLSTPGSPVGRFWESQTKLANSVAKVHCMSAYESPRVSKGYIKEAEKIWGRDSSIFKMKVLGEFAEEGEDQLFHYIWLERAFKNPNVPQVKTKEIQIGVDVATDGADHSVFTARRGNHILARRKIIEKVRGDFVALELMAFVDSLPGDKEDKIIVIDDSGAGQEVSNTLIKRGYRVVKIKPGASALHEPDNYENIKAEAYWHLRNRYMYERISDETTVEQTTLNRQGFDMEKIEQAVRLRYKLTLRNKLRVLDGRNAPSLVGTTKSPDIMDSEALAFYPVSDEQDAQDDNIEDDGIFIPPIEGEVYLEII